MYVAGEHAVYFTAVPNGTTAIKRLDLADEEVSVVVADANGANGMTLGPDGRLLVCEQGSMTTRARIAALDSATGERSTVVDSWAGRPFNSPNDIVLRSDGSIWFTDPSYGHLQGFRPPPRLGDYVYRYDPASDGLAVVADGFDKPNGLAFSPDETVLYVADNGGPHHLKAFDVVDGPAGGVLWLTTILVFAIWFWELDRGGPGMRSHSAGGRPDFAFAQMRDAGAEPDWAPRFSDYLYTSFTNAATFGPADAVPLTVLAKGLMALESLIALTTLLLVVSRAVNVLG